MSDSPISKTLSEERHAAEAAAESVTFARFLQASPPGQEVQVSHYYTRESNRASISLSFVVVRPAILLHCDHEKCSGERIYRSHSADTLRLEEWNHKYLTYVCSNCAETVKTFSIALHPDSNGGGVAYKYGELPQFGPRVPAKLMSLVGADRELFLQGRRCEVHNLGLGAFVYYRRVVEDKKAALIDKIIEVVQIVTPGNPVVAELEAAKKETQFTKAVDKIKLALPEGLLINGRNPLLLLHRPLSEGIHNKSDAECLQLATSIRIVLTELVDRANQLLKNDKELADAIKALTAGA